MATMCLKSLTGSGSISPDGRRAATTARDATVRIWDTETGREIQQLPEIEAITYQTIYSNDGRMLAVAQRGFFTLHDGETGELLAPKWREPSNILDLAFSPDNTMLAVACTDRNTRIYTVPDLTEVAVLPQILSWLHSVDWSADGRTIVTSGNESDIRLWDTSDWSLIGTLRGNPRVYHVRFSPHSDEFLSISPRAAQIWQIDNIPSELGIYTLRPGATDNMNPPDQITFARSSPLELGRAWSVGFDRAFHGEETNGRTLFKHRDTTLAVDSYYRSIEPDGNRAINMEVPSLHTTLVNQENNEVIMDWEGGPLFSARWSPCGNHLATISVDGDFRLYDGASLEHKATLGPKSSMASNSSAYFIGVVGFDKTSERVFTARRDGDIDIWSTKDGSLIRNVTSLEQAIFSATFSPDGSLFAAGGLDGRVTVWDTETWELVSVLRGHSEYVLDISFTADNRRVISAGHDNQVKLWDTRTGREVQTVFRFPDERFVLGTGFMKNDTVAYTVVSDGNVYIAEAQDWTITGDETEIQRAVELEKRKRRVPGFDPQQLHIQVSDFRPVKE